MFLNTGRWTYHNDLRILPSRLPIKHLCVENRCTLYPKLFGVIYFDRALYVHRNILPATRPCCSYDLANDGGSRWSTILHDFLLSHVWKDYGRPQRPHQKLDVGRHRWSRVESVGKSRRQMAGCRSRDQHTLRLSGSRIMIPVYPYLANEEKEITPFQPLYLYTFVHFQCYLV